MSHDDENEVLKGVIALQERRSLAFRSMTSASQHMRSAAGLLEGVRDERAQRAMQHLLDAVTELTSIEVPRC
jgi:hypothetical protein